MENCGNCDNCEKDPAPYRIRIKLDDKIAVLHMCVKCFKKYRLEYKPIKTSEYEYIDVN